MITTLCHPELSGNINSIPSKSHVHRLLIAAALYGRHTKIICDGKFSDDINATIKCLQALGAEITISEGEISVCGMCTPQKDVEMFCAESGSTLRFMLPVVCALGVNAKFHPEGRLPQRPLSPLREELIAHGCSLDEVGTLPYSAAAISNLCTCDLEGIEFILPLSSG